MITITILREYDDVYVAARHYPLDRTSKHYGATIAECRFTCTDRTKARLALRRSLSSLLAELDDLA